MTGSTAAEPPSGEQGGATAAWGAQPPPPPPPSPPPPLTRSPWNRRIAGVCGGLGEHFGVSPLVFRLAFVLLTFTGGVGILLYTLAVLLIPERGAVPPYGRSFRGWPRGGSDGHTLRIVVAVVLLIAAVSVLTDSAGVPHGGFLWGAGLVAIGVFLLVQERNAPATAAQPLASAAPAYAAGSFAGGGSGAATIRSPGCVVPAHRRGSVLGLVTVAAALLALGVAILLDSAGVISLSVATGFALALLVVGAGLVAGAWIGRSRALIVIGALLLPGAVLASLIDVPLRGGTGTVVAAPGRLADVQPTYQLAAGDLTVDLSQLSLADDRAITASVALGKLIVIVPPRTDVLVTAHAGAGHINLFGAVDDGIDIGSTSRQTPTQGGAVLQLTVRVGLGDVEVTQADASATPGSAG